MEIRTPVTPEDVQIKSSDSLREKLVISNLFQKNVVTFVLSHHDRILIGGSSLQSGKVTLEAPQGLSAEYLLVRRELGLVCLSGSIEVIADGAKYSLKAEDIIYIGRGTREIEISGTADIYFTSSMCHADHPTTLVTKEKSDAVVIGDKKFASERTLRKYIHDQGVASSSNICPSKATPTGLEIAETPIAVWLGASELISNVNVIRSAGMPSSGQLPLTEAQPISR